MLSSIIGLISCCVANLQDHLADGLHMIDFEQLKIENQTLNEKIEERNDELIKLKRRKATNVHVCPPLQVAVCVYSFAS